MKICYVDESGGIESPDLHTSSTPVMTMSAVIVDSGVVPRLTRDFVALKARHFAPAFALLGRKSLDAITIEVKGTKILSLTRSPSKKLRRQADRFRHELLNMLEDHGVKVLARVWVKTAGQSLHSRNTYGYAVQDFARHFNHYLVDQDDHGVMIADSRDHGKNLHVAHSVFTQKWKYAGDPYPRLIEVPLFAASDNHAGLQIADHLASGLLFPMATAAFCAPGPGFVHQPSLYEPVRQRFSSQVKALLYGYRDARGHRQSGMKVNGELGKRTGAAFWATFGSEADRKQVTDDLAIVDGEASDDHPDVIAAMKRLAELRALEDDVPEIQP